MEPECVCGKCDNLPQLFPGRMFTPCPECGELFLFRADLVPRNLDGAPTCQSCVDKVIVSLRQKGYPAPMYHYQTYGKVTANY